MAWLISGQTFARKVKDPNYPAENQVQCPSCGYTFDTSEAMPKWPGLPAGVKFDPTDKEILEHLADQVGLPASRPHPFINEFIPTLEENDGICYTHPEKLPGIRRDGTSTHFFHRPTRAYTTGTRKRRKVHSCDEGEIRWHKTGKTRPVLENNVHLGWKKIMVLYVSSGKKMKPEKTNWVMHQYHLGVEEEEREGELVVSKVFYQIQPRQAVATEKDNVEDLEQVALEQMEEQSNDSSAVTSNPIPPAPSPPKELWENPTPPAPSPHKGPWENPIPLAPSPNRGLWENPVPPALSPHQKGLWQVIADDATQLEASLSTKRLTAHSPDPANERLVLTETNVDNEQLQVVCEDRDAEIGPSNASQSELPGGDHFPSLGSQPFSGSLDADLLKLLCSENLKALSQGDGTGDWKSLVAEVCSKLESQDAPSLDKIVLGTPPDLLEHLFNSPGSTADWAEKLKLWGDSQKTEDFNLADFLLGSQPFP